MPTFFLDVDTIDPNIPTMPVFGFSDGFDRADGPLGVTPTQGKPWQHLPLGPGGKPARIYSNTITNTDAPANSLMVVDAGITDGVFRTQIAAIGDRWGGVAFRVLDDKNYYRIVPRVNTSDSSYVVAKVTDGLAATIATSPIQSAASDVLEIRVFDDEVSLYVNGAVAIPPTAIPDYSAATKFGYFLTGVWSNFNWSWCRFDV